MQVLDSVFKLLAGNCIFGLNSGILIIGLFDMNCSSTIPWFIRANVPIFFLYHAHFRGKKGRTFPATFSVSDRKLILKVKS